MERIDALDSKAGVIVAANGVLAGFLLSRDSRLAHSPRLFATVLIVSVFLSMTAALLAFSTRKFKSAPAFESTMRLMTGSPDWLRWRFLRNIQESISENHKNIEQKARLIAVSITFLLAAVALLGSYFIWRIYRA